MTAKEFNEKYKHHLKENFYGCTGFDEGLIDWLDTQFQEFSKNPDFVYYQIKSKFGYGRFYADGITTEERLAVEDKITEYVNREQKKLT